MPSAALVVATANVLVTLRRAAARRALHEVLAQEPDLVGLQEWLPIRAGLLRETGAVTTVPRLGWRGRAHGYTWSLPLLGDCVVGARADRFEHLQTRSCLLDPPGRGDLPGRPFGIEPPRLATLGIYRDRREGGTVGLVCHHLVPGAQGADDRYREDRPLLAARHRREVRRLGGLVEAQCRLGRVVYVVGDANFHGLSLPGLVSAWEGRGHEPGTFGPRRRIDDVFGPSRPDLVRRVETGSDHRAVVASWVGTDSLPA